jgi:hypothetical protein
MKTPPTRWTAPAVARHHVHAHYPCHDGLVVKQLAAEAETGYDVDTLIAQRGKRGRPTLGASRASVGSVRLDPELRQELL